jgi:hypothetical protein
VVLVVLAVLFLGHVVAWDGSRDLLGLGLAIAAVIAALTFFLMAAKGGKDAAKPAPKSGPDAKDEPNTAPSSSSLPPS